MRCCSRKTLFILLSVGALLAILITTGKVNAYAIVPYLPLMVCPLMCGVMMFGKRSKKENKCH